MDANLLQQEQQAHVEGYQHLSHPLGNWPFRNQYAPMDYNKVLESLCASFGELRALESLHICYCGIKSLPESFGQLDKLKTLHLQGNKQLEDIGLSFGKLRALKTLRIKKCGLRNLPETFKDLEKLEILKLEDNKQLESFCSSFGDLKSLKELCMSGSLIKSLPESFGQLQKLHSLHLKGNRLEEYPKCTIGLVNLRFLDLSNDPWISDGNCIQSLPNDLVKSNLKQLILDGNPISLPPKSVWKQGVRAIKLYMQEQQFSGTMQLIADSINMLGESEAGKTSIASSLVRGKPVPVAKDDRTRVMSRRFLNIEDFSVCINDFGGHPIYQSVIPVIMPSTGLAIVAYDLTKTESDQEREVAKWVLTAIAKSSEIRIIVAGTRSDKVSLEKCSSLCKKIETFVQKELLAELKRVVETAILQCAPNDQRCSALQAMKSKLHRPHMKFAAVCCVVDSRDFYQYRKLVLESLQKPLSIPSRWCILMMDIVSDKYEVPYISMEHVRKKYKKFFEDDSYEHLEIILNCLVDSSQIIWLKNHERLKEVVFHSPQQIVDICKKVLHHDNEGMLHDKYKADKLQYSEGVLTEKYLTYLLDETDLQVINTIVDFLQNFNLLSTFPMRGGFGSTMRKFAIASNLPKKEPSRLPELETSLRAKTCVRVDLSFEGSIIPLSFFETSLLMISTRVSQKFWNEPIIRMWYDGLLINHNSMHLVMRRQNEQAKIAITAGSLKEDRNPWRIVFYVMTFLEENISISWPGVLAKWVIWCPACIFLNKQLSGRRELDYSTHSYEDYTSNIRRKLSDKNVDLHFNDCQHTAPRVLCDPTPEDFTPDEYTYIRRFYEALRRELSVESQDGEPSEKRRKTETTASQNECAATRLVEVNESTLSRFPEGMCAVQTDNATESMQPRKWHDMDGKQLQEIFRTLSYDLINTMTPEQIRDTTWKLWSLKLIMSSEKDAVLLPGKTTFDAASKLIDIITTKNKKELYCVFLDHQANLKRTDIIEAFTKSVPLIS